MGVQRRRRRTLGAAARGLWRLTACAVALGTALTLGSSAQAPDTRRLTREGGTERRVALVVGNDSYGTAALTNARNDARAVAAALEGFGFTVTLVLDARRSDFGAAVDGFGQRLRADDVALFYYAGHGVQVDGANYLVPVDYSGQDEAAARWNTVPLGLVQDTLRRAKAAILVLDACRNNPYLGSRMLGKGLAPPADARGSLIAFAADAGQTASDNAGAANGLFTAHLLTALTTPGLGVREVFRRVRDSVAEATNGRQFPAVYDVLRGDIVFRPAPASAADRAAPAPSLSDPSQDGDLARREELAFWESIKDSREARAFEEYLRQYPAGRYKVAAELRLADLGRSRPTVSRPISPDADAVSAPRAFGMADFSCDASKPTTCIRLAQSQPQAGELVFPCGIDDVAYLWLKDHPYDLNRRFGFTIDFEANIQYFEPSADAGVIVAFSSNRRRWGDTAPDGLSFFVNPKFYWVRTGLFAMFVDTPEQTTVPANVWHRLVIKLTPDSLTTFINDRRATVDLRQRRFPLSGSVGLVHWNWDPNGKAPTQCAVRYRNIRVVD